VAGNDICDKPVYLTFAGPTGDWKWQVEQYPGPFSFPDSRDLLEVLRKTSLAEREPQGRIPYRVREDPL